MNNINLLHIAEGQRWAGIESHIYSLLSELVELPEINTIMLLTLYDGSLRIKLREQGVDTICLPHEGHNHLYKVLSIKKHLRDNKINILHTHGYLASIYGLLAAILSKAKVRVVITFHQRAEPHPTWKMNLNVHFMILLAYFAKAHIIAVSGDVKKSAAKRFNMLNNQITIIHNGIKLPSHRLEVLDKGSLGYSPNKHTIGIAGRLVPGKGHRFFVDLASAVTKERDDIEFVILGDGPLFDEIAEYIAMRKMKEHIKLMGHKDNILDFIKNLSIMVICSDHEGIPYILLESLMLKIPVISTDVGGIPEVITHGMNGLLVKPGDNDGMKEQLVELIDHPERRIELGENGYNTIKNKFLSSRMAHETLNLYFNLINNTVQL